MWQPEGCAVSVEYSRQVLEELRLAAEEGFQKIPHGGIEVGALLLGSHEDGVVRVREWRPIECEHARGPGFVLSEKDQQGLETLIGTCTRAAELRGLEPVGWFHTHTRSRIFLSQEDQAVHERFFPEPWQLALVMRLTKDGPASAGFFAKSGGWNPQTSPREFNVLPDPSAMSGATRMTASRKNPLPRRDMRVIRPGETAAPAEGRPTPAPVASPEPRPVRAPRPVEPAPVEAPDFLVQDPREEIPIWRRWQFVALAALAVLGLGAAMIWSSRSLRAPESAALRLDELGGQLSIRWDRGSRHVAAATRGVLEITDGRSKRTVELSEDDIRRGAVTYERRAEDVEVRLEVYNGAAVTAREVARFVGQPRVQAAPAPIAGENPEVQRLREETERLREMLQAEKKRGEELDQSLRDTDAQLKQDTPAPTRRGKR